MTFDWIASLKMRPATQPALITVGGAMGYGDLARRAAAAQALWTARGLRAGSSVLLAVSDERQLLCLLLGAFSAGLTVMIADPELPPSAAADLAQRFEPECAAVDQAIALRWQRAKQVWAVPPEAPPTQGAMLKRLLGRKQESGGFLAQLDAASPAETSVQAPDNATQLIFFTSGSTASPKAVELTDAALTAHLATLARQHGYGAASRLLNPLPLHHVDGLIQGPLVALHSGAALYRPLAFTPHNVPRFLDLVYSEAISHMVAVPTMLALMLRLGASQSDSFATAGFRHIISTAGHLELTLWRRFEEHFKVLVTNTYGLTETVAGGIFCGPDAATRKIGTLGKPVDCIARIVDESAVPVVDGETGELLLQGANLMRGYYRNAGATAAAIRDGWLHTGDLAWRDPQGFIHFAGRRKSVIVSGGHNIYPEEVTEALSRHRGVQMAATLGMPHPDWEEIVVAVVVAHGANAPDEAQLLEHCREHLAPYKIPRRIVFVDALPYGPSGKVRIEQLRAMCMRHDAGPASGGGDLSERVMGVARSVFPGQAAQLNMSSGPENTPGWDSFAHIEFVVALEKEFGKTLSERDIVAITNLQTAADIVVSCPING